MNIGTPIAASRLPFDFTGTVIAYEYTPGEYYALLKSSGTLTPKANFTADLFMVSAGYNGGDGATTNQPGYRGGVGGAGGVSKAILKESFSAVHADAITIGGSNGAASTINSAFHFISSAGGDAGGAGGAGGVTGTPNYYNDAVDARAGSAGRLVFNGDIAPFNQESFRFGGGGGGGGAIGGATTGIGAPGGAGGGGKGGNYPVGNVQAGTANYGGGGGGGNVLYAGQNAGGAGGSGLIMLRGSLVPSPIAPTSITVPGTVDGGSTITVTWGAGANATGYRLERSADGAAFVQIYDGESLSCMDNITKGWLTVAYRVRSYNSIDEYSGYTTSPTRTVVNNAAPEIACETVGNLGVISEGFEVLYTVTDEDDDPVTVVEKMDGVTKRAYEAVLGEENTFDVTGEYFMKLLNGKHTMTVIATDAPGKSTSMTWTFEKAVHSLRITLKEPLATDALINKLALNIVRGIPMDAEFKVLVTNNANDGEPVWEDATANIIAGYNYIFENTAVINSHAFNFIITASRGPGGSGGYIGTIGGAFE